MVKTSYKNFTLSIFFTFLITFLTIFCALFLTGCRKASAEEISDIYPEIESYYFSSLSNSNKTAVRNIVFDSEHPLKYYWIGYHGSYLGHPSAVIVFSEYPDMFVNTVASISGISESSGTLSNSNIIWQLDNDQRFCRKTDNNDYVSCKILTLWVDGGSNPWCAFYDYYRFGEGSTSGIPYWIYKYTLRSPVGSLSIGSNRVNEASLQGYKSNAIFFRENIILNPTDPIDQFVSDSRLKISTVYVGGEGENVVFNLNAFYQETGSSPASGTSFSDLTVGIDYISDGEVSKHEDFLLTDSNSDIRKTSYPDNLVYLVWSPYSVFGDFLEYDSVVISSVSFDRTFSVITQEPVISSFNILTEYYLKFTSSPVAPEELPFDDDTEVPKLSASEITNIYYKVNFEDSDGVVNFDTFFDTEFPDEYSLYYVVCSNYTWEDLVSAGTPSLPNMYTWITSQFADIDSWKVFISNSLRDNAYSQYFDCIVYQYIYETSSSRTNYFAYYPTTAGRLRTANCLLADIYIESNKTAYNTFALYDFLYNRLNDFEEKSLLSLGMINDNEKAQVTWLQSVNMSLMNIDDSIGEAAYNIVNAILSIDIPDPTSFLERILLAIENIDGSDFSGLESKLDRLINFFLANNASGSSSYLAYSDWLRSDSGTNPAAFASTSFNVISGLYDYIPFNFDPDKGITPTGYDSLIGLVFDFLKLSQPSIEEQLPGWYGNYNPTSYFDNLIKGTYDPYSIGGY